MTDHQPMQPVVDMDGCRRFRVNAIVRYLLDAGPSDMNSIALQPFSEADRRQFAQLIGYSVCGYESLSYAEDDPAIAAAEAGGSDDACIGMAIRLARGAEECEDAMGLLDTCRTILAVLAGSPTGLRLAEAERRSAPRTPEQERQRESLIHALVEVDGEDRGEAERRVDAYLTRKGAGR